MYLVSSFPIFLSIPIAFYLHTRSYINNAFNGLQDEVISAVSDDVAIDAHVATNNDDLYKLFYSTTRTFGVDGYNVNVLDLSRESLDAQIFNNKNVSKLASDILEQDMLQSIIYNVLLSAVGVVLINYTVIGILLKIALRKCSRSCKQIQQLTPSLRKYFSRNFVDGRSVSETSSDDEEECFVECSSELEMVDREESIPKANQEEEKLDVVLDKDGYPGYFKFVDDDSGITDLYDKSDDKESTNDVIKTTHFNDHMDGGRAPKILTSTLVGSDKTPEKFKRFLHERCNEIERLGISIESDENGSDEDGYLFEDENLEGAVTEQSDDCDTSFCNFNSSFWDKITLLA